MTCQGTRWVRIVSVGCVLLGFGGCLGPNPGFFISTSVANAGIFTLVSSFVNNVLGMGGG